MRWFKHMTNSRNDEKLAELLATHGLEGYAFWWLLLEVIGAAVEKDHGPELTYPITQWALALHSHPNRVRKYLVALGSEAGSGGCSLLVADNLPDGRIRVQIPNLLKYRDEYSRKSGHSPDSVRRDTRARSETETETETEAKRTSCASLDEASLVSEAPPPLAVSANKKRSPKPQHSESADAVIDDLQKTPAFARLDVRAEYDRCAVWCATNRKAPPSKRRLVNWLLRSADNAPLNGAASGRSAKKREEDEAFRKALERNGLFAKGA